MSLTSRYRFDGDFDDDNDDYDYYDDIYYNPLYNERNSIEEEIGDYFDSLDRERQVPSEVDRSRNSPPRPPPTDWVVVDELAPVKIINGSDHLNFDITTCLVCLEDMEAGEEIREMPLCHHLFHSRCLCRWLLERRANCPLCTRRLQEDQGEQKQEPDPPGHFELPSLILEEDITLPTMVEEDDQEPQEEEEVEPQEEEEAEEAEEEDEEEEVELEQELESEEELEPEEENVEIVMDYSVFTFNSFERLLSLKHT
ncbi:hypothetical protein SUGI_0066410 [Cryptomeria japonica]|nr:hypothetical protein SUGI_0066410 [Cryptomeria japonica]